VKKGFASLLLAYRRKIPPRPFQVFRQPRCASAIPSPDIFSSRWCSYLSRQLFIRSGRCAGKVPPFA
jgi:hypothetical protein